MTEDSLMPGPTQRTSIIILISGLLLFVLSRLIGPMLFDNDWSLVQWAYLPSWYIILWGLITIGAGLYVMGRPEAVGGLVSTPRRRMVSAAVFFVMLFVLQFDSFVYSAGNLRVAQLAQSDHVILRWYEYGAIGVSTMLFAIAKPISNLVGAPTEMMRLTQASVWTWKTISFVCAALSIIAAWRISSVLTDWNGRRVLLFCTLFFGPHALVLFGFVGLQPLFVAASFWFFYFALKAERRRKYLLHLWLVVVVGTSMSITVAALGPAAIYLTAQHITKSRKPLGWTALVGLLVWGGLLAVLYAVASSNLEYVRKLLFFDGKRPFADYGIFSLQHLGDLLQILLMLFPVAFVAKYLVSRFFVKSLFESRHVTAMLMTLGGVTLVWITDPSMSIVLDFPALAAFLAPVSILAAILVASLAENSKDSPVSAVGLLAVLSVMVFLSYLPLHTSIESADGYARQYLDDNKGYYYAGGLAFRDAYFYIETGDKPRANDWEQRTRRESPVMLLMEGSQGLVTSGKYSDALNSLHRLSAEYPFLAEPREAIAKIEWSRNRFDKAQLEVDTLRLIYPYQRSVRVVDYKLQMARGQVLLAGLKIDSALALYPGDPELLVDKARVMVLLGDFESADEQVKAVLADHPNNVEALLMQARLAEQFGNTDLAISSYERFIQLSPTDPDITSIRKRYNNLVMEKRNRESR